MFEISYEQKKHAEKTFDKILSLYKKNQFSSALALIEKEHDLLGSVLNMGNQQQLNKIYAICAYEEIQELLEKKPNSTRLQKMINTYVPMLEVHLPEDRREQFHELRAKFDSTNVAASPSKKRFHNISSPEYYKKGQDALLIITFIVGISAILVLSVLFIKNKFIVQNTSVPSLQEQENNSEQEKNDPTPEQSTTTSSVVSPPQNVAENPSKINNVLTPENTVTETPATSTPAKNDAQTPPAQTSDYILPSSERTLTENDMQGFDKQKLNLAINELFAKHGYDFGKEGHYYEYFLTKNWYKIDTSITRPGLAEDKFSKIEHENLNFLLNYRSKVE